MLTWCADVLLPWLTRLQAEVVAQDEHHAMIERRTKQRGAVDVALAGLFTIGDQTALRISTLITWVRVYGVVVLHFRTKTHDSFERSGASAKHCSKVNQ